MAILRVYADTSVFGGCFDAEFAAESKRFFELVRGGKVAILISDVVVAELSDAPSPVRALFESLPEGGLIPVELTPQVVALRDAYLAAGILSSRWADDAMHVAAATAARADAIVSWNFRHIVRLDKMRAFNAVNIQRGYGLLSIVSPQEIRSDEADEEGV